MTNSEFSNTFDTLLNSYNSQAAFGESASKKEITLDEYEKSVLLTQAQDIIVKSYFDSRTNATNEGFDDSERRQVDFSSLITTATPTKAGDSLQEKKYDERGIIYSLPRRADNNNTDVLFILNEKITATVGGKKREYVVIPLNYKEYNREMSKPYAQPLKKQAWRLFQNTSTGFDVSSEIIPRYELQNVSFIYRIRYVKRPQPIILEDLEKLDIDGLSTASECELNPIIHMDILNKAVELAISTRGGTYNASQAQQQSNKR